MGLLDPAGETALMIRRLIVPLTLAVADRSTRRQALAQGAFPAPLPGQAARAPANDPAFPPVNGAAPTASVGAAAASPFPSAGAAPVMGGAGGFGPPPGAPPPGRSAGSLHEGFHAVARGCGKEAAS